METRTIAFIGGVIAATLAGLLWLVVTMTFTPTTL